MDLSKIIQMMLLLLIILVVAFADEKTEIEEKPDNISDGLDSKDNRDKRHYKNRGTGPVLTFVKTDKNANYKWGVRHHVGHH
ncbi:hypothetical protein GWI33_020794 [Rhynchophorus ferrugineus]|uniref:Uncharacterized protein n=1 Tax=Rhynchophorus ferrugineus TaxID=354439 RepID=A0A834M2Y8_RHYFE|nr:hypothetical protein GWI33_020794 [Rhynchophorus ferrugineus]